MNVNKRLKLAGFFLTLSEWDRHIEVIRQILNSLDEFEPYAAFLRITKGKVNYIKRRDICDFLRENGVHVDERLVGMMVRLYDTNFENRLDFKDFLTMILTRDNPDVRFESALRPNYDVVGFENVLSEEIEYTLARFFKKACEFLQKMISDPETQRLIDDTSIFGEVDVKRTRRIDFNSLKTFFEVSKIVPRDSEMIAILRVIDINDDGIITEEEFNYFIELFSHREPSESTLFRLRDIRARESRGNKPEKIVTETTIVEDSNNRFTNYTPIRGETSKTPSRVEEARVTFSRTQPFESQKLSEVVTTTNYRSKEGGRTRLHETLDQPLNFRSMEGRDSELSRTDVISRRSQRPAGVTVERETKVYSSRSPREEPKQVTTTVLERRERGRPATIVEEREVRRRSPARVEEVIEKKTTTNLE